MAGLPENQSYKQDFAPIMKGGFDMLKNMGKTRDKGFDTSQYKPLTSAINKPPQQGQAPTSAPPRPDIQRQIPQPQTPQQQGQSQDQLMGTSKLGGLGTMTVPYGGSTKYEASHPGVDIANKIGTPIPSASSGTVTDVQSGFKQGSKGFGNYIIVTDEQGNKFRYSHLNQSYVSVGQKVQPGTKLGTMGNSGQTYSLHGGTGSHLDFRIVDAYGKYMDPSKYI